MVRSLRRRIVIHLGSLLVVMLVMAMAALWGVNALEEDYSDAIVGYNEMRKAYEVGANAVVARSMLEVERFERARIEMNVAQRRAKLIDLDDDERELWAPFLAAIDVTVGILERSRGETTLSAKAKQSAAVDNVLGKLSAITSQRRMTILRSEQSAHQKRRVMLYTLAAVGALAVSIAVFVGMRLYRAVMNPLVKVGAGVRRFAQGKFDQRINLRGDQEFARLANDFNGMAQQLDELYTGLEKKVAEKTAELLRASRLASVGYLAAGVAHEINNPLGIIAGYGQRAIHQIDREKPGESKVRDALKIIVDEAFRCRGITDKLLELARPPESARSEVRLEDVAREVMARLGSLDEFRDRRMSLQVNSADDLRVLAHEGEIKQLMMNLLVNALQAVDSNGNVQISLSRSASDWVELDVKDNGRGMTTETLEKAFEPFYTEKRDEAGPTGRGTGLGLPITQAIVTAHGGTIHAESEGLGKGSRFIVRLPGIL